MEKYITFQEGKLYYSDKGQGTPVVLLHGYLESKEIWNDFSESLSTKYRVITVDIPGHGKSEIISAVHHMELMADSIAFLLDELGVDKCALAGHSMGGYVAMAFLDKYPGRLLSFSLFHSTPFADNDEKKKNRDREIELVRSGKKDVLFNTNIPKAFADDNLETMNEQVEYATRIAERTPEEGIIALLEGMKARPERSGVLEETDIPVLLILGKKDNYISFTNVGNNIELPAVGEKLILENSGHMGFIEEKQKVLEYYSNFIKRV